MAQGMRRTALYLRPFTRRSERILDAPDPLTPPTGVGAGKNKGSLKSTVYWSCDWLRYVFQAIKTIEPRSPVRRNRGGVYSQLLLSLVPRVRPSLIPVYPTFLLGIKGKGFGGEIGADNF